METVSLIYVDRGTGKSKMPGKGSGYRPGIPQQPYTKWDADKDEVEVDYKQLEEKRRASWFTGRKGTALKVLLVIVVFSLGLILGYVIRRSVHELVIRPGQDCPYTSSPQDYSPDLSREVTRNILAENIERNLRAYTKKVHIAGTHNNNLLRDRLRDQMIDYQLKVSESKYQVLMSYPNWEMPNMVSLVDGNGTVVYQSEYRGPHKPYHPELSPYNAYAPNGTVKGYLVYANFGEEEDFETLRRKGISCKDNIVIVRYGNIYRGEKVRNADRHGAAGVILYSDPAQVLAMHTSFNDVYPKSWWLPPYGTQRGSVLMGAGGGDPLTPGFPSLDGMYHLSEEEAHLPTIPVQPVGYDDAEHLMTGMRGPMGPQSFHGSMPHNVTYQLGPGHDSPNGTLQVQLEVNNEREVRQITNVFGIIEGQDEPDHYVIIGCHYDAWTYGAVDPNSGTSILMEVARVLKNLTLRGWQPRRTIIFAHWDAQEQNLIGSYEWVEENFEELSQGTVAYINLDGAVMGNYTLGVQASPLLHSIVLDASRVVTPPSTTEGFTTLYDMWTKHSQIHDVTDKPKIDPVGSGSDQAAFLYTLGVPVMWPQFFHNHGGEPQPSYPTYHTALDNFEVMSKFIDPDFNAHRSLAQLVADAVLKLATAVKLPLDCREYATFLKEELNSLRTSAEAVQESDIYKLFNISKLDYLQWAIGNFTEDTNTFMKLYTAVNPQNVREVRRINQQLLRLSRAFIHSPGLPGRPLYRNILFAPSAADSYSGSTFTGIRDALTQFSKDTSNQHHLIKRVDEQISIATLAVQTASKILTRSILSR